MSALREKPCFDRGRELCRRIGERKGKFSQVGESEVGPRSGEAEPWERNLMRVEAVVESVFIW
ncbi:MAG: hypothetical protein HUU15_00015 [Candidatus Brocadiae bacterium]|nr:hypothetical protein [Candidatus Brocadiia bacterium]